jgi:hypothetical protein
MTIIKRLIFILLALVSMQARADYSWTGPGIAVFSDAVSACQAGIKYWADVQNGGRFGAGVYTKTTIRVSPSGTYGDCWGYFASKGASTEALSYTVSRGGTECTAPKVYNAATGKCEDPPPPSCPKDQVSEDYFPANGKGSGFPVCSMAGCTVNITYVGGCVGPTATGETACLMRGKTTGTVCNSMTDNSDGTHYGPGQEKPSGGSRTDMPTTKSGGKAVPCPQGTVQGGIDADGVPLCVGSGADPKNPPVAPPTTTNPPVTTQNSDGSTTTTQTTTQQNSDGSTTTTVVKTVVAADGSKTVSQTQDTGKATAGGQGKMDTPNADQANLCKQNPQLAICQNSTVSGDCAAGAASLVCTGDAVQCAQLRYSAELACRQRQDVEDLKVAPTKVLGDSILAGADPKQGDIDKMLKGSEVDVSQAQLDQSGFLGGGSCLANRSISVMGTSVAVDFSRVCSDILPLRAGIMACAFILAYLIVSKSVLQAA